MCIRDSTFAHRAASKQSGQHVGRRPSMSPRGRFHSLHAGGAHAATDPRTLRLGRAVWRALVRHPCWACQRTSLLGLCCRRTFLDERYAFLRPLVEQ
eukprot:2893050-Prymnesium_polylepis.1